MEYYISERESKNKPVISVAGETLCIPFNVEKHSESWSFSEYRIFLNTEGDIPCEIIKNLAKEVKLNSLTNGG